MTSATLSRTSEILALEDQYGARNYLPLDVVVERARGVWMWDVDGNRFLDGLAAYSAVNQGHCHPRIVEALVEQASKVTLTSRAFRNDQLGTFYEKLCRLVGYPKVLPMNTGAEAVETAIKAARKWAYQVKGVEEDKAEILVFNENFHGRTTTIVGFSSEPQYKSGFGPYAPGFELVDFGDSEAAARAIGPNTAAILVEPIQGEGGIIVPPAGFLSRLRELCDQHNCLLIADEIQSGLGRTGRMLACEHESVRPDVVILGKALSGGVYPVSAVLSDEPVLGVFEPGDHGSTYGGNPLGAAVACAALDVLVDEQLCERSETLGGTALERLHALDSPIVQEVRGRGLWLGIELHPEAGGARRYCEQLKGRGLLVKETHENTIRFAPPLVIERDDLDWCLRQIEEVLSV